MTKLRICGSFSLLPARSREADSRERHSLPVMVSIIFWCCVATVPAVQAQNPFFTLVTSFDVADGSDPSALVQASDGSFYGTSYYGGADAGPFDSGEGTVFKMARDGTVIWVYSFCVTTPSCSDGAQPAAGLVQASDGNFYGTTLGGGSHCQPGGCGTVFKITPAGVLTTLHSFDRSDGSGAWAALIQANDGNFYGTTAFGGANGRGTVFKITPGGVLTTLYSFCAQSGCTDGAAPFSALTQRSDGNFYGTTMGGGEGSCGGCGTVFKITPSGTLTTLHSFQGVLAQPPDGANPYAGLTQGSDGNLYGTTYKGGNYNCDIDVGCGTVFQITPTGTLTTLHSFDGADGFHPYAGLVQAAGGNFYGTTVGMVNISCDRGGFGTVFQITPTGLLTTLHNFNSGAAGSCPFEGLVQAMDGSLYGTTSSGGANNAGIVFRLL